MFSLHQLSHVLKSHRLFIFACLAASVFSAIGFFVVTIAVRADLLRNLDFALTVKIQERIPHRLDAYFITIGGLASFQVIVTALVIFLLMMRRWVMVVSSLFVLFVAHVLEIIGKQILFQPPPPFMFYRHPTDFVFPELHVFDVSSYPSGHSLRVTFVTITIFAVIWTSPKIPHIVKLSIGTGLAGFAFLTMLSRVSLGEHWSTDVVGGFFLGLMIAAFNVMFVLWKKIIFKMNHLNHSSPQ